MNSNSTYDLERVSVAGNANSMSKVDRYGWTFKDKPGRLMHLNKHFLKIDSDYQRHVVDSKVNQIVSKWSWIACGTITVAIRGNDYFVIDGQHRVMAARHRSDIKELPCIVFEVDGVKQEASGFLDANTARKPISGIDKFRASVTAGDEVAIHVNDVLQRLGITPKPTPSGGRDIKCMNTMMNMVRLYPVDFFHVMQIIAFMCAECFIHEKLVQGMFYLNKYANKNLDDRRVCERVKKIGAERLMDGATRAAALYARGGARIWAEGMLVEYNRGLKEEHKIYLRDASEKSDAENADSD